MMEKKALKELLKFVEEHRDEIIFLLRMLVECKKRGQPEN